MQTSQSEVPMEVGLGSQIDVASRIFSQREVCYVCRRLGSSLISETGKCKSGIKSDSRDRPDYHSVDQLTRRIFTEEVTEEEGGKLDSQKVCRVTSERKNALSALVPLLLSSLQSAGKRPGQRETAVLFREGGGSRQCSGPKRRMFPRNRRLASNFLSDECLCLLKFAKGSKSYKFGVECRARARGGSFWSWEAGEHNGTGAGYLGTGIAHCL